MGIVQFVVPRPLPDRATACAYMAGSDDVPWATRLSMHQSRLLVERATHEPGRLILPWPVSDVGTLALATTSLRPSDQPYHLTLELARGQMARVHGALGSLRSDESLPVDWSERWQRLLDQMAAAVVAQRDIHQCDQLAQPVIDRAVSLGEEIALARPAADGARPSGRAPLQLGLFVENPHQVRAARRATEKRISTFRAEPSWNDVQPESDQWLWPSFDRLVDGIRGRGKTLVLGPVLPFDRDRLPDWLYLWTGDVDAITSFVVAYVEALVRRYRGVARLWLCGGEFPVGRELGLEEDQALQVAVAAIETVRRLDPDTPCVPLFPQPWGESLGHRGWDLTPLQVAMILMRADLGLAGIALQLDLKLAPDKTLPRELIEVARFLERWARWNKPLIVTLRARTTSDGPSEPGMSDLLALPYVERLCRLCAGRRSVQAILWEQWQDKPDDPAGLVDAQENAKPVLHALLRATGGPAE